MVEGIAARPIDEPDIRVAPRLPVIGIGCARLEQHVGDAGDGDEIRDRVAELIERRQGNSEIVLAGIAERAERIGITAAVQSHLAQHGGKHDAHPDRLLAMVCPLQRMADGDERSHPRHVARKRADRLRLDAAEGRGPFRGLRDAVGGAGEIGLEAIVAHGIAIDEYTVVQALGDEDMSDAQHQRDVRSRRDRQPFAVCFGGEIVPQRADEDEAAAARAGTGDPVAHDMRAVAAAMHIRVLDGHAAEGDDHLRAAGDGVPRNALALHMIIGTEHMRHDDHGGARAVGVDGPDIAAERVQKPVDLALRVVEAPGARPAIGPAEHRLRAVGVVDPAKLGCDQRQGLVPFDLHEIIRAAHLRRAGSMLQPAAPHGGAADAHGAVGAGGQVSQKRRGMRVVRMRADVERPVLKPAGKGAPVGAVRLERCHALVFSTADGKASSGRILPGFMMPFGSMAALMTPMRSTADPCSRLI